ncbi:pyruvate kinase-like protein [Lasiosphaeris hirsuta]|uniref:Pyruvate kinase-like protein n=1 Tax=Lasiosphaeris hirsuta TaxID=260670 RepID=A0AA40APF0_9PEZI|nr:pyruvate kinase-like protein [Lasiosphaeris hirsuta]
MAQPPAVDLWAPFITDTLLEVRTGKMKPMRGLDTVQSGIDKLRCEGPVKVTSTGIDEDEHDYTFHGGPEKAIHGFCSTHYAALQKEYPSAAQDFKPGGFGENFVTAHMNERNVCIGDVMAVGDDVSGTLLQVSLPRQPCFKLNTRFQLKDFAVTTWKTSRTGWYYRVLRPGKVQAGDTIRLVERRHPKWTIERIQEYLHRKTDDEAMNAELAAIEELGPESRGQFKSRVAKAEAKARKALNAPNWRNFKVAEKTRQTPRIVSFVLEAVEPIADEDEAELMPGAHAKVKLGNGLVRAYSIVDGDKNKFQLGISLEPSSRGGSKYMHETVEVGDVIQVVAITEAIELPLAASNHIFVAAGIGLTAFLSMAEFLKRINYSVVLHYAVRSAEEVPFRDRIEKLGDSVVLYDKSTGQRLDIRGVVGGMKWNSHLYFCGPKRLMEEAARETKILGILDKEVHFEAFEADISGDPFEAVVANKGNKILKIGEEETLLEILQAHFEDVASSCSVGNCGTCKIGLKEGRVDHRGTALAEDEKEISMLACVSRGTGCITIEI